MSQLKSSFGAARHAGLVLLFTLAVLGFPALGALAQETSSAPVSEVAQSPVLEVSAGEERRSRPHNSVVSIGQHSRLKQGERADVVVSIFGSSTSAGEVDEAVVAIAGNAHVTGPVGDAVVAVMGDVYVNSAVEGDVVAVLGSVELGPQAMIGGDVVTVGGALERDPAARVLGEVTRVGIGEIPALSGLKSWFKHALLYGRPLALEPGLGWAWGVALSFLLFYMLLAVMFRGAMERSVRTLETEPGRSTLVALLTLVLTPVAFVVLVITVVGIALVPFLWLALLCAGLFGKAVVLATLGRRLTQFFGEGPWAHPAVAVLVGGILVLGLYLVPVLGFIVYKLLGILGLGVVVYTLIQAARGTGRAPGEVPPAAPAPTGAADHARTEGAAPQGGGAAPGERPSFTAAGEGGSAAGARGSSAAGFAPSESSAAGSSAPAPDIGASTDAGAAPPPPAGAAVARARAGFWIRMVALAIDALLVGVLVNIIGDFQAGGWLVGLAGYGALMWKLRGTTVGGIVCGLEVVRFDERPLDWATVIVRALGCFLSLVVVGLGFLWIAFDAEKQAWHDKIAGTVVVRARRGASLV